MTSPPAKTRPTPASPATRRPPAGTPLPASAHRTPLPWCRPSPATERPSWGDPAGDPPIRARPGAHVPAAVLTGQAGASVEEGIAWIRETLALLEIPGLGAFGIRPQDADDIAAKAIRSSSMQGNPSP